MKKIKEHPLVTAVTVTYGARWHLLRQTLLAAQREGIHRVVVVDNGSSHPIQTMAQMEFGNFVNVLSICRNSGSAGGFKAGLLLALEMETDFILLLDDDNQMQPGCLHALSNAYREYSSSVPPELLAVLAYRPDRQSDAACNLPASGMGNDLTAFFGFNIRDIPLKLFRRTPWGRKWLAQRPLVKYAEVATAPYSGLYFHRAVPEKNGLPDERFLLYADDTDFSFRLTRAGGKIILVTDARMVDLELSWNVRTRFGNTLDAMLLGDGDFRAYYSTRNNAYFEHWSRSGGGWRRAINRAIYLFALYIRAVMMGRKRRFALLLAAIHDGEAGSLGQHPDFPL